MITEIEKEFNKCLKDDLDLMCNDAYIVTKDGSTIALEDDIVQQIKKHIDKFDHISMILAYQPYKESFEDTERTYIETQVKIERLNNLNLNYWNIYYDLDKMTNDDNTGWQFLCTQIISLKNPQILKGDDKMNNEWIDTLDDEEDLMCLDWHEYDEKDPYFVDKEEIEQIFKNAHDCGDTPRANKLTENRYEVTFNSDLLYFVCPLNAREEVKEWWKELKWLFKEYE